MRIGELAEATGTTTRTLRFYEGKGLLPRASRTATGYRDYTPEAIDRIGFIHRGQAAGLTLAQIRQILDIRDDGEAPCEHVQTMLDERLSSIDEQINELLMLRANISRLRERTEPLQPESCTASSICQYL